MHPHGPEADDRFTSHTFEPGAKPNGSGSHGHEEEDSPGDLLGGFIFEGETPITAPDYLVKGLLPPEGIGFLGGQSGAGKTFAAVDLALSLATGEPFFGRKVREPVGVLILAAEGAGTLPHRIEAAKRARGLADALPIATLANVPNLGDPDEVTALRPRLRAVAREMRERFGVRLGLVVIDTLAAAFALEDENSAAEASAAIRIMRTIGQTVGALVLPVHHYGKGDGTGLRGSSAYRAGADAVLSVLADRNEITGEVSSRELALAKSRVGEEGPIAPFTLTFHVLGVDDDGDEFGACSVNPELEREASIARQGRGKIVRAPRNVITFHEAFNEALGGHGQERAIRGDGPRVRMVRIRHVREEFGRRYTTAEEDAGKRADAVRKAFKRALDMVGERFPTLVENDEEWVWCLVQGERT